MIICLFYFTRHASTLIRFVKTIRYGDIEVTFQDARHDFEVIQVQRGPVESPALEADNKILRLAEIDPGVAVIEIWKGLEEKLIQLIQHNGMMRFTTPDKFMKVLHDQKKISTTELELFQRLRKIRNESVHSRASQSLTVAEVLEYKNFVDTFLSVLELIRMEPGYIDLPPSKKT